MKSTILIILSEDEAMASQDYVIGGFDGLTGEGKLYDILIFIISLIVGFYIFKHFYSVACGYIGGFLIAVFAFFIAQGFLDKQVYVRHEYYCLDCGQYLGFSGRTCDRCGCNRYTKDDSGVGMRSRDGYNRY